jgi:Spy/CpxP family protein refolding chaperone
MRAKVAFVALAVVIVSLSAAALAQQRTEGQQGGRGRGGGGPPGGGGMAMFASRMLLLRVPEVRKELELIDEQIAAIERVEEELRAKYPSPFGGRGGGQDGQRRRGPGDGDGAAVVPAQWYFVQAQNQEQGQRRGFGQPPSAEERARFQQQRLERAREERAKLAEILLPEQMKRLTEIYIQIAGLNALQDEEVGKELALSDAQKNQMTKVREDYDAKRRELFAANRGGGGDFETLRAKAAELTKTQDDQILAVLTPQQRTKFEEMKGKPFNLPEGALFGGGRGGQGGQGGNRGRRGNDN